MTPREQTINLAKLIIIGMAVQLLVVGYVFWTDYEGRKVALDAAREGCTRDVSSRTADAKGWRIAEGARRAEGNSSVAKDYAALARELERAANINCDEKYPKASLFP